jgi:hypothetical protein
MSSLSQFEHKRNSASDDLPISKKQKTSHPSDKFHIDEHFVTSFKSKRPPFGFNGLGELVYARTYSRPLPNGKKEKWFNTVQRVTNGCYSMQKKWIQEHNLGWSDTVGQRSAKEMYQRMFDMKFLPPGRGLWAMGTKITEERSLFAALNNCAFISTKDVNTKPSFPFRFLMDYSMLGVGCGYDTKGSGTIIVVGPDYTKKETFLVSDSREGWVDGLGKIIDSYFFGLPIQEYDYSLIRPAGLKIETFGGVSSGADPLKKLYEDIRIVLEKNKGKLLTVRSIADMMNLIGTCVIAGNVRRTAEIMLGDPKSDEFLNLKNYDVNPERQMFGWTSNNSIMAELGMNYENTAELTAKNGEPGYFWLKPTQDFGRLCEPANYKDKRVLGTNPSLKKGTKVLTDIGIFPIEGLVNKEFKTLNVDGKWSEAKCFLSGKVQKLIKISLETGIDYYATAEHEWPVYVNNNLTKVKTENLVVGSELPFGSFLQKLPFGTVGKYQDGEHIGWMYGLKNEWSNKVAETYKNREVNFEKFGKLNDGELPSFIWTSASEEFRKGFIDALFSSSLDIKDNNLLFRAELYFLTELAELLGFYGIKGNVFNTDLRGADFSTYTISDINSIIKFASIFDLSNTDKQNKINEIINSNKENLSVIQRTKIINIQETNTSEDVWDITVYNTTHCFKLSHCITGNCCEQSLETAELCCLVEVFPCLCSDINDFKRTLKFAYLYAKTVTLGQSHFPETNQVMLRNRRIGCSLTGIAQFVAKYNIHVLQDWCNQGYDTIQYYDQVYSDWLSIPRSIKTTCIKPSGSVSLLAGATPGMHWPESRYYIRRVRLSQHSDLIVPLKKANYHVEDCALQPATTCIVEIPVDVGECRTLNEVSMWEQLSMAAFLQKYWTDNQVSSTITFKPEEAKDIKNALNYFQYQLKGVSFLPKAPKASYPQLPYEEITKEEYEKKASILLPINFDDNNEELDEMAVSFCESDKCMLVK